MSRSISYDFKFDDGTSWQYELDFDKNFLIVERKNAPVKNWTALDFHQCPNCPLKKEQSPHCPVARNLDPVVEDSKGTVSFKRAVVTIKTAERTYVKECDTQNGLRAIFGVIMASSGCPRLDWLRPLARFHLPFATVDETLFRVLSLQLLKMYFDSPDAEFASCAEKVKENYAQVTAVNHAFINRLRSYCESDADKNALSNLDALTLMFGFQEESNFNSLRGYFSSQTLPTK